MEYVLLAVLSTWLMYTLITFDFYPELTEKANKIKQKS